MFLRVYWESTWDSLDMGYMLGNYLINVKFLGCDISIFCKARFWCSIDRYILRCLGLKCYYACKLHSKGFGGKKIHALCVHIYIQIKQM